MGRRHLLLQLSWDPPTAVSGRLPVEAAAALRRLSLVRQTRAQASLVEPGLTPRARDHPSLRNGRSGTRGAANGLLSDEGGTADPAHEVPQADSSPTNEDRYRSGTRGAADGLLDPEPSKRVARYPGVFFESCAVASLRKSPRRRAGLSRLSVVFSDYVWRPAGRAPHPAGFRELGAPRCTCRGC
jgi:hypothetical protein